jgi:hypothetical protein
MRKIVLLIAAIVLCPIFARAQQGPIFITGNITTAGSGCTPSTNCVIFNVGANVGRFGGFSISINGTYSNATLNFMGSADGTNFAPWGGTPLAGGTIVTTTTQSGTSGNVTIWTGTGVGLTAIEVQASGLAIGTVTVTIQGSIASARASPNSQLTNSAITIAGTPVSLGGSTTSFPSPGAIGGKIPAAGTFTTLNATSVEASSFVDGPVIVSMGTSSTCTFGTTYNTTIYLNQEATAGAAVTCTLPTAAFGKWYCMVNSNSSGTPDTGVLRFSTSAAGQSVEYNGTVGASNGYFISGGAAGDKACLLGINSTQWEAYAQVGVWTVH